MQIESIHLSGYRSIRDVMGKLSRVTVLVGPNGVGKSNLYRALELIKKAADMQLARAIALDGGMSSVKWAGARVKNQTRGLNLHVTWDEMEYEIDVGVATDSDNNPFSDDPYIKTERIWSRHGRRVELAKRSGPKLLYRGDEGGWIEFPKNIAFHESMLCQIRDPSHFPEIMVVRNDISAWRFYHTFRTDPDSPLRKPQPVYRVPQLDSDGANLAATLLTIQRGRSRERLSSIIAKALPGNRLTITGDGAVKQVGMHHPSFPRRVLQGHEISDGTLRFFALTAALLSEEAPTLLVLNEPETSLHPSTFPALAEAISIAAERSQVLIVTHSQELADEIARRRATTVRTLRWHPQRGTCLDTMVRVNEEEPEEPAEIARDKQLEPEPVPDKLEESNDKHFNDEHFEDESMFL